MNNSFSRHFLCFAMLCASLLSLSCEENDRGNDTHALFSVKPPVPARQISRVSINEEQKGFVSQSNAFGFKLLQHLYHSNQSNIALSPLSIQFALGMTVNGARGETASEVTNVLGFGENVDAINTFCKTLIEELPAVDLGVDVRLANAIVLNDKFSLFPSFKELIEKQYYAPVEALPFSDPDKVIKLINNWCSSNTNGLIPIIVSNISPNAFAYLMNALYFKARWAYQFAGSAIVPDMEFRSPSENLKETFLTRTMDYCPYADAGNYHVVSLQFKRGVYSFYVILPKADNGLEATLTDLSTGKWTQVLSSMTGHKVHLGIPKFDITSSFELSNALKKMGIERAFTDGDFSGMTSDTDVIINQILHKVKLSLDENGVEAAAVTIVEMNGTALPPSEETPVEFIADHPFAFVIAEESSGTILFTGVFDGRK